MGCLYVLQGANATASMQREIALAQVLPGGDGGGGGSGSQQQQPATFEAARLPVKLRQGLGWLEAVHTARRWAASVQLEQREADFPREAPQFYEGHQSQKEEEDLTWTWEAGGPSPKGMTWVVDPMEAVDGGDEGGVLAQPRQQKRWWSPAQQASPLREIIHGASSSSSSSFVSLSMEPTSTLASARRSARTRWRGGLLIVWRCRLRCAVVLSLIGWNEHRGRPTRRHCVHRAGPAQRRGLHPHTFDPPRFACLYGTALVGRLYWQSDAAIGEPGLCRPRQVRSVVSRWGARGWLFVDKSKACDGCSGNKAAGGEYHLQVSCRHALHPLAAIPNLNTIVT